MSAATYFAVPDPDNAGQMTYWRRTARGQLEAWPAKARYGPVLYRSDVPPNLRGQERTEWINTWQREQRNPWHDAVRAAIEADPAGCAQRFAQLCTRCCACGRTLTDPASKVYGIGPECRAAVSDTFLADMASAVGRSHAAEPPS